MVGLPTWQSKEVVGVGRGLLQHKGMGEGVFPYLKKGEYDIWAMKMQNFISSFDLLCWNIVLKGNSAKSMTTDNDGNLKIRPPVIAEEHQQVQREEKARTILLSALPNEHVCDFYHMIDARDIWNAIKERFDGVWEKATDSSEIKTNDDSISHSSDYVLFDFNDRSSEPSTNDPQTCDSSMECSRPNHSDHDSTDSISSVSAPANCDLHEQRFAKRNAEGKGILGRRITGKPVNPIRPKPVSAGQQNLVSAGPPPNFCWSTKPSFCWSAKPSFCWSAKPVSAGKATLACNSIPLSVTAGDGILGPRPMNIQPKKTIAMPELNNKMELLKEKIKPLEKLQELCLQILNFLPYFGLKQ
uniref:Xylulose kinase-1 n=1 Tax=Tanacetum cinerariifolium TaxID=118510 RepID=A0A6L2NYY9_TANCI|nr:xylulose kinase-1 [Tanacetum cinerariifolium]